MPAVLGYWKIRGLAQPIRMLMAYAGEEWEDVMYEMTDAPEFGTQDWLKEKFQIGLDFPNLPYYKNGDVKLTQSGAILRHLARKHNLMGNTDQEKDRVEQATEQLLDFRWQWVKVCYGQFLGVNFEEKAPAYAASITETLEPYERYLGEGPWLAGKVVTLPDFVLFELLDQHLIFKPGCLDKSPNLKAFHLRMMEEPKIKAYMKSPKFFKGPINNKIAAWGGNYPITPFA